MENKRRFQSVIATGKLTRIRIELTQSSLRYEVNPDFVQEIAAQGLKFVGEDVDGERMEIIELKEHPFFVGLQAHPEFESRPLKPSPPYLGLLLASIKKLENYLANGCNLTTEVIGDDSDEEYLREEDFSKLMLDDVRKGMNATTDRYFLGPTVNGEQTRLGSVSRD